MNPPPSSTDRDKPHSSESPFTTISGWAAGAACLFGLFLLAGWWFELPEFSRLSPWLATSPINAGAFALGGLAVWMLRSRRRWIVRAGLGSAGLITLLGLLWVCTALFTEDTLTSGATLTLAGIALLTIPQPGRAWLNASPLLGGIVVALGLMGLLAQWALPTDDVLTLSGADSLGTLLLGVALAAARMGPALARVIDADGGTGMITRRLLVMVMLLPPLLYFVQLRWAASSRHNPLDPVALTTLLYTLALVAMLFFSARKLEELDAQKSHTEAERDRLTARLQQQAATLQQEIALRTNELNLLNERYELALRAAHLGVWDWDLRNSHQLWDGQMLAIYGLPGEFSGKFEDWLALVHPDDRTRVRDAMGALIAHAHRDNSQFRIVRPDGAVRHVEVLSTTTRDERGQAIRLVGITRDITADHEHARELRALNHRLQFALISAGYGVWSYDIESGKVQWDERVLRIYGPGDGRLERTEAEICGFIVDEDRERIGALFRQYALGRSGVYATSYRIRRETDGAVRHVHERGYLQRGEDGRPFRVIGLIRDTTTELERERELGSLNERLQFVVTAAGYGVWELDLATRSVTWSEQERKIFGLPPDFAGNLTDFWRRHVHPDDLPEVETQFAEVVAGRHADYRPNYRIVRPDGAIRHVATRSYVVRDAAGKPVRIVGLNRDYTSDRELNERLRITEERWRLALSSNNDGVWDWDVPRDRYFRDQRIAEMLGVAVEELPAGSAEFEQLIHPDDLAFSRAALRAHLDDVAPFYQCEFRMKHRDGRWIWILDRGKVVARDNQNRPLRMVGTQTDITTRKTLEDRLRHNEELSLQLSRLAQIGAWEIELTGNRVTWAPEVYRIHEVDLGYTPTAESILLFYPPDARRAFEEALRTGREHGTPFDLELPFTTARGHRLWVRTLGRAETVQGRVVRLYGAFQDITARRDAEEMRRQLEGQLFQAQKMETLGTLAGGIAHDFNNLLTGILGYQDLALDTLDENHDSRPYLGAARDASLRARELVDQILTFSRQAGSEKVPVNLRHVIEDARRFLRATVPSTVGIEVTISPECAPVLADATQIHQVLLNLGSNAAHAMRATGGTMKMSASPFRLADSDAGSVNQLNPGSYVRIDFTDTGHGMDEETVKRIFDPFFTTKEVGQGTGLGLSVVHGIVQAHQGAITVRSAPGAGTTFSLFLPVVETSEAEAALADVSFPRGSGELVAIVDDEDIVRSFAQMALEKAGYRVASYDQPSQCLEAMRRSPDHFGVLLTDQTMPGMKGIELAAEVRSFAPTVPVIIMSGYFSRISPDMLAHIGYVSLLSKPFTNDELARTIHRCLHPETGADA